MVWVPTIYSSQGLNIGAEKNKNTGWIVCYSMNCCITAWAVTLLHGRHSCMDAVIHGCMNRWICAWKNWMDEQCVERLTKGRVDDPSKSWQNFNFSSFSQDLCTLTWQNHINKYFPSIKYSNTFMCAEMPVLTALNKGYTARPLWSTASAPSSLEEVVSNFLTSVFADVGKPTGRVV